MTMRVVRAHGVMRDAHCLKVSSHKQSTISLSGGENEYSCATIGLTRSMLSDVGMCADVVTRLDLGHDKDWVASGTCSLPVGYSNECKRETCA